MPAHVLIVMYNVQGQPIDTVINENKAAWRYRETWKIGTEVMSGIYFYRVSINNDSYTKKIVVLR